MCKWRDPQYIICDLDFVSNMLDFVRYESIWSGTISAQKITSKLSLGTNPNGTLIFTSYG